MSVFSAVWQGSLDIILTAKVTNVSDPELVFLASDVTADTCFLKVLGERNWRDQCQCRLSRLHWLLGRLLDRVDLIKPVSNVCPCYLFSHFQGRGRWVMHDGKQCNMIQGQGLAREPFKVGIAAIFNSYLLCHLQWELETYHRFLNWGTISKCDRDRFLIFGLVFVSRD